MIATLTERPSLTHDHRIVVEIDDAHWDSLLNLPYLIEQLHIDRKPYETLYEGRAALREIGPQLRGTTGGLIILLDLMFPDQDPDQDNQPRSGLDFIRDLRRGVLGVDARTPVIVLSNAYDAHLRTEADRAGANAFFEKAKVKLEELTKLISFYLGDLIPERQQDCEVHEVDLDARRVLIRLHHGDRWILQRWIPLEDCPHEARIPGGAFAWETIRFFRDYRVQYLTSAKAITDDGGHEAARLLHSGR